MPTKSVTVAWLAEHGITGDKHGDEFYDSPIVRDVDYTHRDRKLIVFADEGKFWRLEVEHHPEDWDGTNDLTAWADSPHHEFTVTQVMRRVVEVWADVEEVRV